MAPSPDRLLLIAPCGRIDDPACEERAPYAFTGTVKQRLHAHTAMADTGHGAAG